MVKMGVVRRLTAIVANLSLLLNSFLPFILAIQPVYAQSPEGNVPPVEVVEQVNAQPTEAPTPQVTPEIISTPAPENTPTPEITPIIEATPTPENIPTPQVTPEIISTPAPENTPTPSEELSPTPENIQPVEEPFNGDIAEITPTPVNSEIGSLNPVVENTPTPEIVSEVEKICLADETIIDSTSESWTIDEINKTAETKEIVKLGVKYIFPNESKVSVTFKCLPKDESLRTTLKIQQIKTSDLKLPDGMGNVGEYAFDITTGMADGTFEYDVTLPKASDTNAEISYIEKSVDDAKNNEIKVDEVKQIEESKVEQQSTAVKALSLDHFTIYIVTTPSSDAPKLSTAIINNQSQVTVSPGETITVTLKARTSGNGSNDNWNSSQYKIGSGNWSCVNTGDHNGDGTYTESFSITAPNTPGTYNLSLNVYNGDNCSGGSDSDYPVMNNAITVVSNSITNPVLPSACGLDIALVLDSSGSIDNTELNQMKSAFKAFVDALLPATPTQFSVTNFDSTAAVLQSFSSNVTTVKNAIDSPTSGGATNWEDGLIKAQSTLTNRSNPDLVIFASDGNPNRVDNGTTVDESQAVAEAVSVANAIKSNGARIIALGIGNDLNINNLKAISGPAVGTNLSADVITSDFATLASTLATFASQTCGGTITIHKYIDNINTPAGAGWQFDVNGQTYTTDNDGITQAISVPAGNYSVWENTVLSGYSFGSAVCRKSTGEVLGTPNTNPPGVNGVTVGASDIVSCDFINTTNYVPICGNNILDPNEECDNGSSNGSVCTPTYGNSCNYCSVSCQNISVTGPYCGDGIMNGDEQCDGNDIGNLSTNDFKCNKSCELELVQAKIDICHASDSHNNPYIVNQPNKSGDVSGHAGHTGPIWYPGITIKWGDIIPPFVYIGGTFPGLNWTTEGQAIYNNGCNFAKGHLIVQKTTIPSGDNTSFSISASGTGDITGSSSGTIKDNQDKDYEVTPGVYSVTETVPSGWVKTGDTCQNVIVNAGETKYCQITNTKKGSLKIIKDSRPDDTQNFIFRVTKEGSNIGWVELDDDGDTAHSRSNNYTFTNLVAGTYKVTEDSVSGWTLDNINCTNTTGQWGFSSGYLVVDILPGEQPVCTFTNGLDTGTLTAHKFEDHNNNQVQNPGENNLKDWDMNLYSGSNCHSGNYIRDLDTNSSGDANFGNLVPGNYSVRESLKTGWQNSTPLCQNVTVNHNDNKVVRFGNYKLGKIEGRKFYDKDSNRTRDGGEDYLSGWRIFIDENGNGEYNSGEDYDYTDSNGYYKFDGLAIGSYTVCEQMKSGWYNSTPICQTTNISSNDTDTINFGNLKYGSIKVCKIIIDGSGKVVNGSETPGTSFTINWNNGLSPTVFNTGYTPNSKLLKSTPRGQKDAFCTTIDNLRITNYRYREEIISDSSIWQTPKYNDQYDETINDIGDFYIYDQNTNSNGDINLALDPPGINRTLVLLNQYKYSDITVVKYNDINGDGVYDENNEETMSDWTINLSGKTKVTTVKGVIFDQLLPDTYYLSEEMQPGWTQTKIWCDTQPNNEPTSTPTPTEIPPSCIPNGNVCFGDLVSNGCCGGYCVNGICSSTRPSPTPTEYPGQCKSEHAECQVNNSDKSCCDGLTCITGDNPSGNGHCERLIPAFNLFQVKPVFAQEAPTGHEIVVKAGDQITCYIGNQRLDPKLTISKFNNVTGNLSPGNSVKYTIDLAIQDNGVKNLKVADLLSNGFKYKLGSFKVYLDSADVTSQVTEPQYHSPGVWDLSPLGTLTPENELRLEYIADISTDQQPGKYTDLAYAVANYGYDEAKSLLATAQPVGFVDTNFVGTIVPVVKNTQNSVSAEVEQKVEGQVLGASTELPGTGASTLWLILSSILGFVGLGVLKINKKNMLTLLFALLSFGLIVKPALAADFVLSVQEPKTPSNTKDLKLEFKALHLNNGVITAKCLKKGPADPGFSQFGLNIVLSAGGNSSSCDLNLAINDNGSYQFTVEANDGVDTLSKTVSLDYNTSTPGTPRDYRKENINGNNCDFKIHFKTDADSGKTVKVELYRSTDSAFSANNESLVHSVNIGSDQEYDILNSVPDCSKTYYYALRAFDNAGNGSGLVGDRITVTSITTTTETTVGQAGQGTGAIPVIGADIPAEGEPTTTQEGQENITLEGGETGQVLGTGQGKLDNFITEHKVISSLIGIGILGIIVYAIKKFRKNKKR